MREWDREEEGVPMCFEESIFGTTCHIFLALRLGMERSLEEPLTDALLSGHLASLKPRVRSLARGCSAGERGYPFGKP